MTRDERCAMAYALILSDAMKKVALHKAGTVPHVFDSYVRANGLLSVSRMAAEKRALKREQMRKEGRIPPPGILSSPISHAPPTKRGPKPKTSNSLASVTNLLGAWFPIPLP